MTHIQRRKIIDKTIESQEKESKISVVTKQEGKCHDRDSLSEGFYDEIDVWARRALASNGFGDY